MVKIKPILLNIEEKIWKEFKKTVPATRTINGRITELIEEDIKKQKCNTC